MANPATMPSTKDELTPAYRQKVFNALWISQMVSMLGSGLTGFALRVWAFEQTESVTQFALITFFYGLPGILLSPIAGALADRWNRRWMMILSDIGAGVATISILLLLMFSQLEVWHIYIAVGLISLFNTLQQPAYSATIPLLVPKEKLGRANGLLQIGPALDRIVAPLVAGVLLVSIGLQGITQIDLATFLFALIVLLVVRLPKPKATEAGQKGKGSFKQEIREGWTYINERPGLRNLLFFFAAIDFTQGMIVVLIAPLVLGFADASVLGTVFAVAGVGALLGAITMGVWGGPKKRVQGALAFSVLRAFLLLLGGLQPSAWLIGLASALYLFFSQLVTGSLRVIWQTKVHPDIQGRVFSVRMVVGAIFFPLGQILSGPLADYVFQPLMNADGLLASSLGQWIGVGAGRGIGLMMIVLGILNFIFVIFGYVTPSIRLVETQIPDAIDGQAPPIVDQEIEKTRRRKNKRMRKWLTGLGITLLAIIIVGASVATWLVRRAWPQLDGELTVAGLQEPVEVIRDEWGIPHIYAENEHDLFFAQGYVQAQDRLFQMEVYRAITKGEFSLLVGETAVFFDEYHRNMRLLAMAEEIWENLDEEHRTILQNYADGVNAYIEANENSLPVEYTVLNVSPEPWTPIDILSSGNNLTMHLSSNARLELVRALMVAELGEEVMNVLLPSFAPDSQISIPDGVNMYAGLSSDTLKQTDEMNQLLGAPIDGVGSNAWVVSGDRTETGMPILANDIHLGLTLPSVWYAVGLHGGRFDSVGYALVGIPGVISGHNEQIAWGVTNLGPDTQDYYLAELDDEENPTQYKFDGEWRDLEIIPQTIETKGGEPYEFNIYLTHYGPVMLSSLGSENYDPLVLRWTLFEGDNQLFKSIIQLNLATDWDSFREALSYWHLPGQNVLYADKDGNIGYQLAGRVPLRSELHTGEVPVPGNSSDYEWVGYVPYDELPSIYNPPNGFIVNANSRASDDSYPYRIADTYVPGYRAARISDQIEEMTPITVQDMRDLQMDTYAPTAELLLPYLFEIEPDGELQEEAMQYLRDWDLHHELDSIGATIYEAWHLALWRNIIEDDLSERTTEAYISGQYLRHATQHAPFIISVVQDEDTRWLDDQRTEAVETREDIVRQSFVDAVTYLSENHGDDPTEWAWGNLHVARFPTFPFTHSNAMTNNPLLEYFYRTKPYPAIGSNFSVHTNSYHWQRPFEAWIISNARHVTDMSDFDNSIMMPSSGQNENLYHQHREDILPLWQNLDSLPMNYSREAVEAGGVNTLLLVPEN